MRVAVVLPSLSRSATVTVAFNIAVGLVAAGHSVDIFYFDELVERPAPEGCGVYRVSFFKKFDFESYDVVHSHNLRPDLYVAINRSNFRGVCVSTIHNYVRDELENYYGRLVSVVVTQIWKFAWQRLDSLVCLTRNATEYYREILPLSCISYVYNGVSINSDSKVLSDSGLIHAIDALKKSGFFVLGTYSNQTKLKGLDQIIRLVCKGADLAAIIVGEGPEKPFLVALAKELGVEDRCLFFPYLPSAYIYNRYFDAYIIPSRSEGFGMSLVEAALSDAEIMCSDIPVFREIFDSSEVSFFGLDDMDNMLKIVGQIKGGVSKRGLARRKSQDLFSVDIMANNYLKIYIQALNRLQG